MLNPCPHIVFSLQDVPNDMRILSLLERFEVIRKQEPTMPLWKVLYMVNRAAFLKAGAWRREPPSEPVRVC